MWNPFKFYRLTKIIYRNFVDTGYVPTYIVELIAYKIVHDMPLTVEEMAVYAEYATKVEDTIKSFTKKSNDY